MGTNQVHDYNPGVRPSGLFWTQAIPRSSVEVDLDRGTAAFRLTNAAVPDYGDFVRSITGGAPTPATVSFDVRWGGVKARHEFENKALDFAGQFAVTGATVEWSARQAGFTFQSDPAATSKVDYAEIGHERSGVFYRFPNVT